MKTVQRRQTTKKRMTLKEYLSGPPDEFKAELVNGELVVSPSPSDQHQELQFHLEDLLRRWVRSQDLGWVWHDLDMVLDEANDLAYRPDILFLAKGRARIRKQGRLHGPADLAVEIRSPSEKLLHRQKKFSNYERYGVSWYWIIHPKKGTIEEYELSDDSFRLRSHVSADEWFSPGLFPGLQLRLRPLLTGDLKSAVKGRAKTLV